MARIALFGGSFNPIHLGHLAAAEGVVDALSLERVVFVPAGTPPHKTPSCLAPAAHRMRMVELAVRDNPRFELWDFEARASGTSFTIDTVRDWKRNHGAAGPVDFVIGADTVRELPTWRSIGELFEECTFVVVSRPGWGDEVPNELADQVGRERVDAMWRRKVNVPLVDVSSSELRRRLAEGRSVRYLVPDAVIAYIREHGLYLEGAHDREGLRGCQNATDPS